MSHKINHREVGQGPTLVLLHGFGGSVMHWDGVVNELKNEFKVVVPNIAHLYLSPDKIFFSVQVEVLAKYLREHFQGQKVSLAGVSYGGALAWALTVHYPDLVERLILINPMMPDPVGHFRPPEMRYFFAIPVSAPAVQLMIATPIGKSFLRRMAEFFRSERSRGRGRLDTLTGKKLAFVGHIVHRFTWILRNEDWSYWKAKISRRRGRRSCIMIYDVDDPLCNEKSYLEFGKELGAYRMKATRGAGHLSIKTKPDVIAKHIREFLAGADSQAA